MLEILTAAHIDINPKSPNAPAPYSHQGPYSSDLSSLGPAGTGWQSGPTEEGLAFVFWSFQFGYIFQG